MEAIPRELRIYERADGRAPFSDWMNSIENLPIYETIMVKLEKVERGNLGDARSVGAGVSELEIDADSGYRVYFGQIGKQGEMVVLLNGGTKSTQSADIETAKGYWKDFCRDPKDQKL